MQRGKDITARFPGLFIVHHNLPGSMVPSHSHPEHHLIIPLQGETSLELKEQTLLCSPGRMVYIPPHTEHIFRSAREKGERLICMIEGFAWADANVGQFQSSQLPASQLCKEILFHLLMNPQTKNASALVDVLVRTLGEILGAVPTALSDALNHLESSVRRPELNKAIEIARTQCCEKLSISELARRSGMSVRNLSRLFQIELGMTPKQLLMALRIEKSKELLLAGNITVTEVAFSVGYSSLSQFIAVFRQFTGQIPSEFK